MLDTHLSPFKLILSVPQVLAQSVAAVLMYLFVPVQIQVLGDVEETDALAGQLATHLSPVRLIFSEPLQVFTQVVPALLSKYPVGQTVLHD